MPSSASKLESNTGIGCILVSCVCFYVSLRPLKLIANPLHILQQNLLAATVIEFRGPAVGVAGYPLSGFKGAVIFQKIRDAGRPE